MARDAIDLCSIQYRRSVRADARPRAASAACSDKRRRYTSRRPQFEKTVHRSGMRAVLLVATPRRAALIRSRVGAVKSGGLLQVRDTVESAASSRSAKRCCLGVSSCWRNDARLADCRLVVD